jgi:predicted amino acid dehydrogenase
MASPQSQSMIEIRRTIDKTKVSMDNLMRKMLAKSKQSEKPVVHVGPDVVFLAHPAQLFSIFALWGPKQSDRGNYWRANWWMDNILVTSFIFFVSSVYYPIGTLGFKLSPCRVVDKSRRILDKTTPATDAESKDDSPGVQSSEVWFSKAFAWQYMITSPSWQGYAKEMIVRSASQALNQGVKVFGLGALNKADWLNHGGEDVVKELEKRHKQTNTPMILDGEAGSEKPVSPVDKISIVHGNTLTAAVVCHQLKALLGDHSELNSVPPVENAGPYAALTVIITGPTTKIGRAIALTMAATENVRVICVERKSQRLDSIIEEARLAALSTGKGSEITACATERAACDSAVDAVWVLGKEDKSSVLKTIIPPGSRVLSYANPCPLSVVGSKGLFGRKKEKKEKPGVRPLVRDDLRYLDSGVMVLPESLRAQRQFDQLLPNHLVYTCHAAALVHHLEGWEHHEVREVPLEKMDVTLAAAIKHGFSVNLMPPREEVEEVAQDGQEEGEMKASDVAAGVAVGSGVASVPLAAGLLSASKDTASGSVASSVVPTASPSVVPSVAPTASRSIAPSSETTASHTVAPSAIPTASPSVAPSVVPTASPTPALGDDVTGVSKSVHVVGDVTEGSPPVGGDASEANPVPGGDVNGASPPVPAKTTSRGKDLKKKLAAALPASLAALSVGTLTLASMRTMTSTRGKEFKKKFLSSLPASFSTFGALLSTRGKEFTKRFQSRFALPRSLPAWSLPIKERMQKLQLPNAPPLPAWSLPIKERMQKLQIPRALPLSVQQKVQDMQIMLRKMDIRKHTMYLKNQIERVK